MNHSSTTAPQPTSNHNDSKPLTDIQNQMIVQFSQQSGMNIEHSKSYVHSFLRLTHLHFPCSCLEQNNWDYTQAATVFLDLQQKVYSPTSSHPNISPSFSFRIKFHLPLSFNLNQQYHEQEININLLFFLILFSQLKIHPVVILERCSSIFVTSNKRLKKRKREFQTFDKLKSFLLS